MSAAPMRLQILKNLSREAGFVLCKILLEIVALLILCVLVVCAVVEGVSHSIGKALGSYFKHGKANTP